MAFFSGLQGYLKDWEKDHWDDNNAQLDVGGPFLLVSHKDVMPLVFVQGRTTTTGRKADSEWFFYVVFCEFVRASSGSFCWGLAKAFTVCRIPLIAHKGKIAKLCIVFQWNEQASDYDEDLKECWDHSSFTKN